MNAQLIHILDQSVCLSRRQTRDYLSGSMDQEEQHAVEIHIVACPLCGLAMEGLEKNPQTSVAALSEMNTAFLKAHFDTIAPQIHLNSMAPASAIPSAERRRQVAAQPIWKHLAIIALLLGTFALLWYFEFRKDFSEPANSISAVPAAIQSPAAPVEAAAKSTVPPHTKSQSAGLKSDEELISKAKEMNARKPAEISDDELNNLYNASVAEEKQAERATPAAHESQTENANQKSGSDTDHVE